VLKERSPAKLIASGGAAGLQTYWFSLDVFCCFRQLTFTGDSWQCFLLSFRHFLPAASAAMNFSTLRLWAVI
jgi:hypothetical protein